jgi:hypothetical protein
MSLPNNNAQFEMKLVTYVVVTAVVLLPLPSHFRQNKIEVSTQAPIFFVFVDTVVVADVAFVRHSMKVTSRALHDV